MHETLCFSIQSPSPNVDDLPLRCDGCETVSCVVGSFSDHGRIILESFLDHSRIGSAMYMGLQVVLVDELPMEFHCDLQL